MSDLGYPYALKPTEQRGQKSIAWRFWPVSPRNVSVALYEDVVAFNLHRQVAAIGYGNFPLHSAGDNRDTFASDAGWSRTSRDIAFQFTWQMKRGDIIFICMDVKYVLAWGLLLDNVPLFFGDSDPIWKELGPLRQRVWDEGQGEQFCNYRRVDRWRIVESAPQTESGQLPGSAQPTVMSYKEADIVRWLGINEDLKAARLNLPAEFTEPEGYELAPRAKILSANKGQGRQHDQGRRTAVELHAMELAKTHFRRNGYDVDDVSSSEPFDLLCTKSKEQRQVEVKGTTLTASSVDLTAGEVTSAWDEDSVTDLFVVSDIVCIGHGDSAKAKGGTCRLFRDWEPKKQHLQATAYRYTVPKGGKLVRVTDDVGEEE